MTARDVPAGALFYAETRRRTEVLFDADLRRLTEDTIHALAAVLASGRTPPPTLKRERCRACSLLELCRPAIVAKPVQAWRRRMVERELAEPLP